MGLVALYGISFGNRRTYQWLTAMMVNLFVNKHIASSAKFHSFCYLENHQVNFFWNLFVEQPIKVAIVTMVIACVKKRPKWNQVSTREKNNLQTFFSGSC